MQRAEQIRQALHKMGVKGTALTRIYRNLYSEELYIQAYGKIYKNAGALTPGTDGETADGMSMAIIRRVIEQMKAEKFRFRPTREKGIPKKSGGIRRLGMPDFVDKVVQEVLRSMLEAYYEPKFQESSHGYRPQKGCHTALKHIKQSFRGAAWFIEGDIKGCFDNINHDVLMEILRRDIQDGRLLNLIKQGLEAGKVGEWGYKKTYSGTPQGGILSPLLSNIYMNELDQYVEETLIPQYTKGETRRLNKAYKRYEYPLRQAREAGDEALIKQLEQERRKLPSKDMHDPDFRRLKYVRYADDFILSFIGTKQEAEEIRAAIAKFLSEKLKLELNMEKTKITHAKTEKARFLGYDISIYHVDDKLTPHPDMISGRRSINGHVRLGVPYGIANEYAKDYLRNGKTQSVPGIMMHSDAHIIDVFQARFRGLVEYYQYATDVSRLSSVKNIMQQSLVKTLAHKFKMSVSKIYRKYRGTQTVNNYTYKTLQVTIPTQKGGRTIYWGAIPLRTQKAFNQALQDLQDMRYTYSTDLVQRLQADQCEICGSSQNCEVHHVRKLADLKQRWAGKAEKPIWVKRMIAMQRKTLVVCRNCHVKIHAGQLLPKQEENLV